MRLARFELGIAMEEKEWRKSGKPRRSAKDWKKYCNNEVEEAAKVCNVDLGYVAEIALKLSKET